MIANLFADVIFSGFRDTNFLFSSFEIMDDRKLIELVRDHPELYGAKFNDEIWNRIAAEMGVDGK